MTSTELLSVVFDPPLVNPTPQGLYAAATWVEEAGALRFLANGVKIRPVNYSGGDAFGVWGEPWCGDPGSDQEIKTGVRPNMDPDPFEPITVWAYDECDLTAPSQAEVRSRAQQILRLEEQVAVERAFAATMLADATVIPTVDDVKDAVGYLEGELAKTNTVGLIHAGAQMAAQLGTGLVISSGGSQRTILGHRWVFGGGYVDGLGTTLVATSPVFGWRGNAQLRTVVDHQHNRFLAVAERSLVAGYEKLIAAVTVVESSV